MGQGCLRDRIPITGEIQAEADHSLLGLGASDKWLSWLTPKVPFNSEGAWFHFLAPSVVGVWRDRRVPVAEPCAHTQSANQENYKRGHPETGEWTDACPPRRRGQMETLSVFTSDCWVSFELLETTVEPSLNLWVLSYSTALENIWHRYIAYPHGGRNFQKANWLLESWSLSRAGVRILVEIQDLGSWGERGGKF